MLYVDIGGKKDNNMTHEWIKFINKLWLIPLLFFLFPLLDVSELIPSFSGTSYLSYPWPAGLSSQETRIGLRIRPGTIAQDALILYVEDTSLSAGDYFALGMTEGAVELRFNLG